MNWQQLSIYYIKWGGGRVKKVPYFEDMKTSGEEETKDVTRGKVVVISIKMVWWSKVKIKAAAKESAGASVLIDHEQCRITSDELPGLYFWEGRKSMWSKTFLKCKIGVKIYFNNKNEVAFA